MACVDFNLTSKKLKLPLHFNTIEVTLGRHEATVCGVYRPPRPSGSGYYIRLEDELNEMCTWASRNNYWRPKSQQVKAKYFGVQKT